MIDVGGPDAGRLTRATLLSGDEPFTGRERRPFTGDLDRYGDGTSRPAASWRSFGSSADAPSGSGRDPGRRPSLRRGPGRPGTRTLRAPVRVTHPMPSQRDMAEERDASPARRARRDTRRRGRPSGHFYVADRDEDYATPRLDDDGDGTGDDALGVASKTHDQLPTPLRDPNRREGDQNRRGPRRRGRAPAAVNTVRRRGARRIETRASRADPDADARGGDDSPGDAREASPELESASIIEEARGGVFSPDEDARGSRARTARKRFGGRSRFVSPSLALGVGRGGARDRGGASGNPPPRGRE